MQAPETQLPETQHLNILILGASGYLGRALLQHFQSHFQSQRAHETGEQTQIGQVWHSQHRNPTQPDYFNLSSPDLTVFEPILPQINYAIICGARPGLRDCFEAPEATWQVNVAGPLALAQALVARGIVPVLLSSDYVFAGDQAPYCETDPSFALNPYGKQKVALEAGLKRHLRESDYLLLRLTKLYDLSPVGGTLLSEMAKAWQAGQKIRAAADQVFNPLLLNDCLQAMTGLLSVKAKGVYHLGGPEGLSRFELAQALADNLSVSHELIECISLKDLNEPFLRPHDTRLSIAKVQQLLPDWRPVGVRDACQLFQAGSGERSHWKGLTDSAHEQTP